MKKVTKTKAKTASKRAKKECCNELFSKGNNSESNGVCGGAIYGLGFIGALVYYISTATGFWIGVLGVLKAIVWPALVVFELMKFLGM